MIQLDTGQHFGNTWLAIGQMLVTADKQVGENWPAYDQQLSYTGQYLGNSWLTAGVMLASRCAFS